MAALNRSQRQCDALILGSNLAGLLVAESLRQNGQSVTVLEAGERTVGLPLSELAFFPDSSATRSAFEWLSQLLRKPVSLETSEQPPVHFSEGNLNSFLGFGDQPPASLAEIEFFLNPHPLALSSSLHEVVTELVSSPLFQVLPRKAITRLIPEGSKIAAVEVNGEELWRAPVIINALSPTELLTWLGPDALEGKHRTRIAKAPLWTSVTLLLHHHRPLTHEMALHILFGSGHESAPVLGHFAPASPSNTQSSLWFTLVPSDEAEDHDRLSHALKHIKRQLKRTHHLALDDLLEEKVVVANDNFGHFDFKTKNPFVFPELGNLWLASPLQSSCKGPLAALDMASRLSSTLLAQPQVPIVNEGRESSPDLEPQTI